MIWKRTILLGLLAVTGLALETSILGGATLLGTKPPLLLLLTIAVALAEGPVPGATAGFVMGLLTDLVLPPPRGITALAYTLIGYGVGKMRAQFQAPTVRLPLVMVFGATAVGVLVHGGLAALLSGRSVPPVTLMRHAALGAAYNSLLAPFIYPAVRALARRLRPAGAVTS